MQDPKGADFRRAYAISAVALVIAAVALTVAVVRDAEPADVSPPENVPPLRATAGPAAVAANPDVNVVNEDGITQLSGDRVPEDEAGVYLVVGSVRVNDFDATSGGDTAVGCRIVRNPSGELVDGRTVRLLDTGTAEAPLQTDIALNGVVTLDAQDQLDLVCAQEAKTGNVEATVDSARLSYVRVGS